MAMDVDANCIADVLFDGIGEADKIGERVRLMLRKNGTLGRDKD